MTDLVALTQVWVDGPFRRRDVNGTWRWVSGYWRNQRTGESLEGKITKSGTAYTAKERKKLGLPSEPDPPPPEAKPLPDEPPAPPKPKRIAELDRKLARAKKAAPKTRFRQGQRVQTLQGRYGTITEALPRSGANPMYRLRHEDGSERWIAEEGLRSAPKPEPKPALPDPPKYKVGQRVGSADFARGYGIIREVKTGDDGVPIYMVQWPKSSYPSDVRPSRQPELLAQPGYFDIGKEVRTKSKRGGISEGYDPDSFFGGWEVKVRWPNGKVESLSERDLMGDTKFQTNDRVQGKPAYKGGPPRYGVAHQTTKDIEGNAWVSVLWDLDPDALEAGDDPAVEKFLRQADTVAEKDLKLVRPPKARDRVQAVGSSRTGTVLTSRSNSMTPVENRVVRWDDTGEQQEVSVHDLVPSDQKPPRYRVGADVKVKRDGMDGVVERALGFGAQGWLYDVRLANGSVANFDEKELFQPGRPEATDKFKLRQRVRMANRPPGDTAAGYISEIVDRNENGPTYEVQWDTGQRTQVAEYLDDLAPDTDPAPKFMPQDRVEFEDGAVGTVSSLVDSGEGIVYTVDLDDPGDTGERSRGAFDADLKQGPLFKEGDRVASPGNGIGTVIGQHTQIQKGREPKTMYRVVFDEGFGGARDFEEDLLLPTKAPPTFVLGARVAQAGRIGTITAFEQVLGGGVPQTLTIQWDVGPEQTGVHRGDVNIVPVPPKFAHGSWARDTKTGEVMRVTEVWPPTRRDRGAHPSYRGWIPGRPIENRGSGSLHAEEDLEPAVDPGWEPAAGWDAYPNEAPSPDAPPPEASRAWSRVAAEESGRGRFDDERITVANLAALEERWRVGGSKESPVLFDQDRLDPTGENLYWRDHPGPKDLALDEIDIGLPGELVEPSRVASYWDARVIVGAAEESIGRKSRWTGKTSSWDVSRGTNVAAAFGHDGSLMTTQSTNERVIAPDALGGLPLDDRTLMESRYRRRLLIFVHEFGHSLSLQPENGDDLQYTRQSGYEEPIVEAWARLHYDEIIARTDFIDTPKNAMQTLSFLRGFGEWGAYQNVVDKYMAIAEALHVYESFDADKFFGQTTDEAAETAEEFQERQVADLRRFFDTLILTPIALRRPVIEAMARKARDDGIANQIDLRRLDDALQFLDTWEPERG